MIEIMNIINKLKDSPRFFSELIGLGIGLFIGAMQNPLVAFIFLETFLFLLLPHKERIMIAYTLQFSATAYVIFGHAKGSKQ